MEQKLAQLTDQLYKEGVAKGEEEAKRIVDNAKSQAAKIIADAREQAEKIVGDANKEAEELKRNVAGEIKLSGQQAVNTVKQQILDLVTTKLVDEPMNATLSSPDVLKELIKTVVQNWKASEQQAPALEVLLPESKQDELDKALKGGVQGLLKEGVSASFSRNIKGGFQIGPQDGSFRISMTDEDFAAFFKEYLRPRTRTYLYGE